MIQQIRKMHHKARNHNLFHQRKRFIHLGFKLKDFRTLEQVLDTLDSCAFDR